QYVDDIPEARVEEPEEEKGFIDKAFDGVKQGAKTGLDAAKATVDFLWLDDARTVMDGSAPITERLLSGVSFIPAGKIFTSIRNGYKLGKGKIDKTYSRPSGYRKGVRDEAWEKAKGADGKVRDPGNGKIMNKEEPWDMGHKPGYEFRKHQKSAQERGVSRKQFLDEHNNSDHYRPELPSTNRSHKGEDLTDNYFGD
ncbi:HNH/ENDO VII family nuclease, partial [Oceanobacillus sp. CFH 90083]|uniref:HNH/ENDO VII family nuclease n=1 Tax=Oceanobacillus sp. CFH 90083 TaxID=2592336 RepID=UPI001D1341DE